MQHRNVTVHCWPTEYLIDWWSCLNFYISSIVSFSWAFHTIWLKSAWTNIRSEYGLGLDILYITFIILECKEYSKKCIYLSCCSVLRSRNEREPEKDLLSTGTSNPKICSLLCTVYFDFDTMTTHLTQNMPLIQQIRNEIKLIL